MKIAFIVGHFPRLSETFILNQITGLIDRGHEVDIFASIAGKDTLVHQEVLKYNLLDRTHYLKPPKSYAQRILQASKLISKYFPKHYRKIIRSLNFFKYGKRAWSLKLLFLVIPFLDKDFDIIHCHFGPHGMSGVFLKENGITKAKNVTSFHGGCDLSERAWNKHRGYSELFKKGDLMLPACNFFKDLLIKGSCPEKKIIVHYSGTDLSLFKGKDYNKKKDEITILSSGRLVPIKGFDYAIRAVARLLKNNKDLKVRYLIFGNGEKRKELEDLTEELNIKDKVFFGGEFSLRKMVDIMQEADIFLSANVSNKEEGCDGAPGVIKEAEACSLPVVATKVGGIPEGVLDGVTGFLIKEKDVNGLVSKLEYLIKHPEKREEMGEKGREYVEKNYDINKLNDRLVNIYQRLIRGELP